MGQCRGAAVGSLEWLYWNRLQLLSLFFYRFTTKIGYILQEFVYLESLSRLEDSSLDTVCTLQGSMKDLIYNRVFKDKAALNSQGFFLRNVCIRGSQLSADIIVSSANQVHLEQFPNIIEAASDSSS